MENATKTTPTFGKVYILFMPTEVLFIVEWASALHAFPLSLILVELEMKVELISLYEAFTTYRAGEWPLCVVEFYMLV